jgi:hypothetical protein
MWDLDTIIQQNNRVALEAMMEREETREAQSPRPQNWPLTELAAKLHIGPPLIEELLKAFTNADEVAEFIRLIREFLPEYEDKILYEGRAGRVYMFCYFWEKKYWPLPRLAHERGLRRFLTGLPVILMGNSYSAYHDMGFRPGYALLFSLVVYPFEGDWRDKQNDDVPFDPFNPMYRTALEDSFEAVAHKKTVEPNWRPKRADIVWVKSLMAQLSDGGRWVAPMGFTFIKVDDRNIELRQAEDTPEVRETIRRTVILAEKAGYNVLAKVGKTAEEKQGQTLYQLFTGGRVPVLNAIEQLVGMELVKRLPPEGWEPEHLHKMTDGTKYEGVGHFADWACKASGTVILDESYEDTPYVDGATEPVFPWTRRNVDILTSEWPRVQEYRHKIGAIVDWLEVDPPVRYRELIDYLLAHPYNKKIKWPGPNARALYDETEHFTELDVITDDLEDEHADSEGQEEGQGEAEVEGEQITLEDFIAGIGH